MHRCFLVSMLLGVLYHRTVTLQPVFDGNTIIYELDFKYLAALLECPVVKTISI